MFLVASSREPHTVCGGEYQCFGSARGSWTNLTDSITGQDQDHTGRGQSRIAEILRRGQPSRYE